MFEILMSSPQTAGLARSALLTLSLEIQPLTPSCCAQNLAEGHIDGLVS
jgi:hypothetical protein